MATTYTVTRVRKELSANGTHRHVAGVCDADGNYSTRATVVESIKDGDTWKTSAGGYEETIEVISFCPASGCLATPYIKTKPDSTKKDNLENLEEC